MLVLARARLRRNRRGFRCRHDRRRRGCDRRRGHGCRRARACHHRGGWPRVGRGITLLINVTARTIAASTAPIRDPTAVLRPHSSAVHRRGHRGRTGSGRGSACVVPSREVRLDRDRLVEFGGATPARSPSPAPLPSLPRNRIAGRDRPPSIVATKATSSAGPRVAPLVSGSGSPCSIARISVRGVAPRTAVTAQRFVEENADWNRDRCGPKPVRRERSGARYPGVANSSTVWV